jgi:hypothetical protein
MRRFKDVASLLRSLAIMSQGCSDEVAKCYSEMRTKCEKDIHLFEDEAMFCKAYFVLPSHEHVIQEEQRMDFRNAVDKEGKGGGYEVPSYEQLAASLAQIDKSNP